MKVKLHSQKINLNLFKLNAIRNERDIDKKKYSWKEKTKSKTNITVNDIQSEKHSNFLRSYS